MWKFRLLVKTSPTNNILKDPDMDLQDSNIGEDFANLILLNCLFVEFNSHHSIWKLEQCS